MKRGGLISILLIAALMTIGAGCGGDSDTTAMSKAEVIKRAEVLCNQFESEREEALAKALEESGPTPNTAQKEMLLTKALEPYEALIERLDELGAPQGEEQQYDEMVEAMEEAVQRAKANPESAFTSDLPFREANKQVKAFGLENCVA